MPAQQQNLAYWGSAEGQAKLRAGGASDTQLAQAKNLADQYLAAHPDAPTSWQGALPDDYQTSMNAANQAGAQASLDYSRQPDSQTNPNNPANTRPGANVPIPGGAPTPSNYLEDLWTQYGGAFFQPSNQDKALPGLQQQLAGPGAAEQFYQHAQNTDTDPYYQRLQQQGTDSINQQMAARGHFNSGAAVAGLGNFESGLKAQEYHDLGGYAAAAQAGQNSRIGLAGQLNQSADATDTTRLQAAFQTAGSAQNLNQQAVGQFLSAQTGLDQSSQKAILDAFGKGGDLASEAGRSAIEAQVRASIAAAGGTQAQQDTAVKAIEALIAAL